MEALRPLTFKRGGCPLPLWSASTESARAHIRPKARGRYDGFQRLPQASRVAHMPSRPSADLIAQ